MHLDFSFSEAEGSAPLHHRVITNGLDDRWPWRAAEQTLRPRVLSMAMVKAWRAWLRVARSIGQWLR